MVPRETVSFVMDPRKTSLSRIHGFVFQRVLFVSGNIRTRGKTKLTILLRDHKISALLYI